MTFGLPGFFWAAFALLPLAAVYFIRTRPRRQLVNAYFLWESIFQQKANSSLFQKLRNFFSLLILILAFIACVFALTNPRLDDGKTPDLLIIIDRSASMSGTEDGKTRLELAKEKAGSWIKAISGSQRAAIASAAQRLEYHANLTTRPRLLRDALAEITESDLALSPHVLSELSLLSESTKSDFSETRILFLTDRRSAEVQLPDGVEVVKIGSDLENIGITAADLRWDSTNAATLFVTLSSSFSEERQVELELVSAKAKNLIHLFTLKIPAKGEVSESLALTSIRPGAYQLRLTESDQLTVDDSVPLGLNAPVSIPVKVSARNPFFFHQVIDAFSKANSLFSPTDGEASLAFCEGQTTDNGDCVIFAPKGESPFWETLGDSISAGAPEIIAKDHPLLARLDPSLLTFDGARELQAPDGAVIVLSHNDGTPLIYTISKNGRSAVVFNFDPIQEDFFISPWFPVFVHDAAVLLTGRSDIFPSTINTGLSVKVPGTDAKGQASMLREEQKIPISFQAEMPILEIGNYQFVRNQTEWHLGGALLSPAESAAPLDHSSSQDLNLASGWPIATWLLFIAMLGVITEEVLYHRRKVG